MAALDTNNDGVLGADEIAKAPTTLMTLDKNGDGVITPDEFYGLPPGRGNGQNPPAGNGFRGRGPGGPPAQPVFAALDANHDGVIDANEIANASTALLRTLDRNGDGQLTPNELFLPFGGPGFGGPPRDFLFGVLDANHDGVIDANEIANASTALLRTLDRNGDGQLTPDELFGPRGGRAGQQSLMAGNGLRGRGARMAGATGAEPTTLPEPPLMAALDANHDGVIDATEIANAPAALVTLDKNGDGKLTPDELRPIRQIR
jgi:Ca2+-binding EF-hand superfamily protein